MTIPKKTGLRWAGFFCFLGVLAGCSLPQAPETTEPDPEPETRQGIIGIEIASSPNTTLYAKNQPFDPAGLLVNKVYHDGSTEALAGGYMVDPVDTAVPGSKTVWVQWQNYEAPFTVYVDTSDLILTDLTMTKGPTKTEYYLGESFSKTGIEITGTYSDSSKIFDGNSAGVRGYDKYMRGPQTVSLTVNNRTFTVPVKVKVPANAEVSLNPYKEGGANHQAEYYKGTYIKGAAFEFEKSNLRAKVTVGGVTMTFTPGRGLYP
ncbi:MAG: bacterial Ig-like domain-containing protein, partial [Treponema sp.]|nr:bacterial Ig-like domain-containing protein [Treponema sp.]